jgi:hypothetical protein
MTAANKEMKTMMKNNKELDLNYIDKMQDSMFDMMVGLPKNWVLTQV